MFFVTSVILTNPSRTIIDLRYMQCRGLYTGQPVLTTAVWPENNTLRIVHKSLADKYEIIQVTEFDEFVYVYVFFYVPDPQKLMLSFSPTHFNNFKKK